MHTFWLWVYYNSPTIQAVCAVLGIGGLFFYARDTSRIRQATLSQADASRRPFLIVDRDAGSIATLKNLGAGIALDVEGHFLDAVGTPNTPLSLPTGLTITLFNNGVAIKVEEIRNRGYYTTYSDTAGKRYWSRFEPRAGYMSIKTGALK